MTAFENRTRPVRWRGWLTLAMLMAAFAMVSAGQAFAPAHAAAKIADCTYDNTCGDSSGGGDDGSGDTGSDGTGSDGQDVGGGYVGDNGGDDTSAGSSTAGSQDPYDTIVNDPEYQNALNTLDPQDNTDRSVDPFTEDPGDIDHDPRLNPFDDPADNGPYVADPAMVGEIEREQALDAGRLSYDPQKTPVSNRPPTSDAPKAKAPSVKKSAPAPAKANAKAPSIKKSAPAPAKAKATKHAAKKPAKKHTKSHKS